MVRIIPKGGRKRQGVLFDAVLAAVFVLIGLTTIYPFLNVLAISFNDSYDTLKGGIYILPRKITMANYLEIFKNDHLLVAFFNSVRRTVIGTVLGVLCSSMMAYTLSRKDFMARNLFSFLFAITMYVGGGMIPSYILIRDLHLFNTFAVYILPLLVNTWNVFVIRSFMDSLPDSIQESAKIDGANDLVIFLRIVFPLCMPVLATVSLFIAVDHWNAWFDSYLYNNSKIELTTLQFELQKILTNATTQVNTTTDIQTIRDLMTGVKVTPESIKMAMAMVATVPILCVYPFLQKYFVKGLTMGAIKS